MTKILLDKSAFQALSIPRLVGLAETAQLCLPEAFFFEALTTDPRFRSQHFRKLRVLGDRLHFAGSVGRLTRVEDELGRPARIVEDAETSIPSRFLQDDLAGEVLDLPTDLVEALQPWKQRVEAEFVPYIGRVSSLTTIFPVLEGLRPHQRPDVIEDLMARLGGDSAVVREIFAHIADERQLRNGTGPAWVGYRLLQSQLIWTLNTFHKFGAIDSPELRANLENSLFDNEYATLACQADQFLTRDNELIRLFGFMGSAAVVADGAEHD